ncbi:serine acetyltransferase [Flavobacterium sp. LS1R47]|uniref:Serine acetyltransferase n=1 Tax=Flavobacterium frigoritolerans TaxID=2987686 RepID=A0A9X3C080_9FLAO|nr:serine acetyltransferase [Flavobacterium frigoritolerans]MCV9931240.1 serine acetyltransferase [Flavobacterium frigoritolerans]
MSMLREIILSDYKRCGIYSLGPSVLIKVFIIMPNPGLKFLTIFRLTQYYRKKNRFFFYFFFLWLRRLKFKYGFDISYRTKIGKGLYIGHFGGVVIHGDVIIGENCNLSQGITIGVLVRGNKVGVPKIGNRVFIGPGATILGEIIIGNDVLLGTNAIVTFDVPDSSVVAAPLATIISNKGSEGYIIVENKK